MKKVLVDVAQLKDHIKLIRRYSYIRTINLSKMLELLVSMFYKVLLKSLVMLQVQHKMWSVVCFNIHAIIFQTIDVVINRTCCRTLRPVQMILPS